MTTNQLNAINAAKAWYRKIMKGAHPRDVEGRRAILNGLDPSLKRLAHMMANLLDEERREKAARPSLPYPEEER
jgi:hypothetical protein